MDFCLEDYVNNTTYHARKNIACIRSSAHDLNIERGRYATKLISPMVTDKTCRYCCAGEARERLKLLEVMPISFEPIIESEEHVLVTCPAYYKIRLKLSENLKSLLMLHEFPIIMNSDHSEEFGQYLRKCYRMRNPKQDSEHKKKNTVDKKDEKETRSATAQR